MGFLKRKKESAQATGAPVKCHMVAPPGWPEVELSGPGEGQLRT